MVWPAWEGHNKHPVTNFGRSKLSKASPRLCRPGLHFTSAGETFVWTSSLNVHIKCTRCFRNSPTASSVYRSLGIEILSSLCPRVASHFYCFRYVHVRCYRLAKIFVIMKESKCVVKFYVNYPELLNNTGNVFTENLNSRVNFQYMNQEIDSKHLESLNSQKSVFFR